MNDCCRSTYFHTLKEILLFIQAVKPTNVDKLRDAILYAMTMVDTIDDDNL